MIEELKDSFSNLDDYSKWKIMLDMVLDTCLTIEKLCSKKGIKIEKLKSSYVLINKSSLKEKDYMELLYIYFLYLREDLALLLKDL